MIGTDYRGVHRTTCDYCGKRVFRHVAIGVRMLPIGKWERYNMGWGWFEGHLRCWPLEKQKMKKPVKAGDIRVYNYR